MSHHGDRPGPSQSDMAPCAPNQFIQETGRKKISNFMRSIEEFDIAAERGELSFIQEEIAALELKVAQAEEMLEELSLLRKSMSQSSQHFTNNIFGNADLPDIGTPPPTDRDFNKIDTQTTFSTNNAKCPFEDNHY